MSRNPPIHFADSRAQAPGQAVQPGYITDTPPLPAEKPYLQGSYLHVYLGR